MKKLLGWLAIGIAVMWVIHDPTGAANLIHQVAHALSTLADSL